ncbi:MAG: alpha/beta hydrolase [Actinomycetota bacterium]|nr:alpha/beta hydrolase [Actinomycetota bacterium]
MTHHTVTGGGGVRLHVVETGNPSGQAILFIHGWSQSHLVWSRQLNSPLSERFRLVSLDNRGHGDSDKPPDAYGDSQLWADDIQAVIDSLSLNKPVLSGWSYGGLIINDYLRHHGQDRLGGINYVGAVTDLAIETPYKFLGASWNGLLPGEDGSLSDTVFSANAEEAAAAMRKLLRGCFAKPLPIDEELLLLGLNLLCPPRVRLALFSRTLENDDVLAQIRVPVLVTHGAADEVVDMETGQHIASHVQGAKLSVYDGIGHASFWEDADRFNTELAEFASSL